MHRPRWIMTCWSFDSKRLYLLAISVLLIVDGIIALIFLGAIATQFSVVLMGYVNRYSMRKELHGRP